MEEPLKPITGENPVKKVSIIVFIILFLVVVGAAFFVYLKSQNIDIKSLNLKEIISNKIFTNSQKSSDKKPIEIRYDAKEHNIFAVYKDYIIKCTKSKIQGLDKTGEEQWSIPISMNEPIIKISGSEMLVADIGGRDIYVLNGKDIKWSTKIDNTIINADINESGYVTVVKEEKRTRGAVTVFNLQGNEFFTKGIGESFIFMAKISPSGKQVFISSIDSSGIKANTILEITDILGKSISSNKISQEGIIYPSIWYLNNDSMIAVSDDMMACFDKTGRELWNTRNAYPNIKVHSSKVALGKYPVLATGKPNSNVSEIDILNMNGQQVSQYQIEGSVINIEVFSDVIAVNTGREVHFINTKGKLVGKYSSKSDIIGVNFFNKTEAEIITKNSVVVSPVKQ